MSALATLVADGRILGGRAMTKSARNPATIVGAVVFPVLFFVLFNLVFRRIMDARGFDYRQLLPSTVVIQAMLFAAMSSAYYVADDRRSGIIARLLSLPIHRAAPLIGRAVGDLSRAFVSVVVIAGLGLATGMRFERGWLWALPYIGVALFFCLAVSLGMGLIGYVAPTPEAAASIASMPYLPLIMLSSGFAPVEDFPDWLEPFVQYQPVSATIDALRAMTGDGAVGETLPLALAWSAGLCLVFAALGSRALRSVR
ncbi:MAG: ABC transporter permease [Actinomycetota bacterium]